MSVKFVSNQSLEVKVTTTIKIPHYFLDDIEDLTLAKSIKMLRYAYPILSFKDAIDILKFLKQEKYNV